MPHKVFSRRTLHPRRGSAGTRKLHEKQDESSLATNTTCSAGTDDSSYSGDDISVASSLHTLASEKGLSSQRLHVAISDKVWTVTSRRGDSIATLKFPEFQDEMLLYNSEGQVQGIILQTNLTSPSLEGECDGCFEYNIFALEPCYQNQTPTGNPQLGLPSLYFCARIEGNEVGCMHQFSCHTSTGREFVTDKVMWSTLTTRAFCIKEKVQSISRSAARVTCLGENLRELVVYPRVDPTLILGFMAIMEEILLVSNL